LLNLTELGVDVLIIWKKNSSGFTNKNGLFKNEWGIAETIAINNDGLWKLPTQYVKNFK
jgi:hypothetical protein